GLGLRPPVVVYGVALLAAAGVVAVGLGGARLRRGPDSSARPTMSLGEAWRSPVYRAVLASAAANGWTNFGVRMAVLPLLAIAVLDRPWPPAWCWPSVPSAPPSRCSSPAGSPTGSGGAPSSSPGCSRWGCSGWPPTPRSARPPG